MAKKSTGCKCVEQVNKKLLPSGLKLTQHIQINFLTGKSTMSGPCVEVQKLGKKGSVKIPAVLCSFCPFCGKAVH